MVIEQAYINLIIMLTPVWAMLMYIVIEEMYDLN
jgi:hypothetical protein